MFRLFSKAKFVASYLLLLCLICTFSFADILEDRYADNSLMVIIGETKPLRVHNPRQIKIGNPKVLDVVVASRSELLLSGLSEGDTQLTITDDFGQQVYTVQVFQDDLDKLKERINVLLGAAGLEHLVTKIGTEARKIFIMGNLPLAKKEAFENKIDSVKDRVINLVEYYEDTPSVEIDVEVLEILKEDLDNLGFTWNQSIAFSEPSLSGNFADDLLNPKHALQILKDWRTTKLAATLNVLKENNKARTLSRPKLVCMSGKEAKLLVGGEVPIIGSTTTTSAGADSTYTENVEMREYGISLEIRPVVNENDMIQVGLNVEITDIDTTISMTLATGSTTPGFLERSAQTELTVPNGQTVFLAGMIKSYNKDNRQSVPFLSKIPFMGALFRNKDLELEETEIVISLTPTILRSTVVTPESPVPAAAPVRTISPESQSLESVERRLVNQEDPVFKYSALIQDIINSNIKYPQELGEEEIDGSVKLSLHLLSTGELSGVIIMQSSGNVLLDEAAEYSVRKLSPYPAFPSEIKLTELWIEIPIVYRK